METEKETVSPHVGVKDAHFHSGTKENAFSSTFQHNFNTICFSSRAMVNELSLIHLAVMCGVSLPHGRPAPASPLILLDPQ